MALTPNLKIQVINGSDKVSYKVINAIISLLDKLGVAYVTEVVQSGNWYLRKWSDGRVDGWATLNLTDIGVKHEWGGMHISDEIGRQAFPLAFSAIPHMTVTWGTTSGDIALAVPYNGLSATSTGTFILLRGPEGTTSGVLSIHVSGRVS